MRNLLLLSGCVVALLITLSFSAEAGIVCATFKALSSGPGGNCSGPGLCTSIGPQTLIDAWKAQAAAGYAGVPVTVPTKITSCKTVPSQQPGGWCDYIVCGYTTASLRPTPRQGPAPAGPERSPCAQPGDPCHQKSSNVGAPGILDGDSGLAGQGATQGGARSPSRGQ